MLSPKTKRSLWICLILFLTLACGRLRPAPHAASPGSSWDIDPQLDNLAILVLDYQSLQLQAVYFTRQESCSSSRQPVSDEELLANASEIFNAAGDNWSRRMVTDDYGNQRTELVFKTYPAGDLTVLEMEAGDFGGFAVLHRCSGMVLYAGSTVWDGTGEQLYAPDPINLAELAPTEKSPAQPEAVRTLTGTYVNAKEAERGQAIWSSVQDLNIVQDLAKSRYDVLVYLYPRSVGMFNPGNASWVIFVQMHSQPVK